MAEQENNEINLEEALQQEQEKSAKYYQDYLYAKAEQENIRRRASEDVAKSSKYAIEKFSSEIIAVKDSLEAGLVVETENIEEFKNGMELTLKQLIQTFEKFGIKEINPIDEVFDANKHQAISSVDSDKDNNVVVSVLQKGYELNERLVRPALVIVSNGNKLTN